MPVTIVIVNFNGGEPVLNCLRCLKQQVAERDILIVDNASTDGSPRAIHAGFPDVAILPFRRNVGFARAVNIASSRIPHDGAIITLNPDTQPCQEFVQALLQPLADDPRLASTAGTLVFSTNPAVIASAGICVHRNGVAIDDSLGQPLNEDIPAVRPVFGASGGAAAYRLSAFHDAGGFYEPFFLYLEDVDLAWRLRLRGWECASVRGAVATHDYSSSSGEGSAFKRRLLARNRIWTLARCLPNEVWARDRATILAFDLLAAGHGTVTFDTASLRGRAAAVAGLPRRLQERKGIHGNRAIDSSRIAEWIQPAISPRRLVQLRQMTGSLARKGRR